MVPVQHFLTEPVRRARAQVADRAGLSAAKTDVEKTLVSWFKRLMVSTHQLESRQHWWRRRFFNPFAHSPGTGYLLVNILCLAEFLGDRPPFDRDR